jgi:hypothetical protein
MKVPNIPSAKKDEGKTKNVYKILIRKPQETTWGKYA